MFNIKGRNIYARFRKYAFIDKRSEERIRHEITTTANGSSGRTGKTKSQRFKQRLSATTKNSEQIRYRNSKIVGSTWWDRNTSNIISSNNPADSALEPKNKSEMVVRDSDISCFQRYQVAPVDITFPEYKTIINAALNAFVEMTGIQLSSKYTPRDIYFAIESTSNKSNSGWPLFKRKNSTSNLADVKQWLVNLFNNPRPQLYSLINNPIVENTTTLFHRFQISVDDNSGETDVKIRQVWALPHRIVALECIFFDRFVAMYKAKNVDNHKPLTNAGLDNSTISSRIIRRLRERLELEGATESYIFSLDYKKFDSTIPQFAKDLIYAIVAEFTVFTDTEWLIYNHLRRYLKYTPVLFEEEVKMLERGFPSGSFITHFFVTWWNLTLMYLAEEAVSFFGINNTNVYSASKFDLVLEISNRNHEHFRKIEVRHDRSLCGDDGLILCEESFIKVLKFICLKFKMQLEVFSRINTNRKHIWFLGRYWNSSNAPVQSGKYMSAHICFRTKFYKSEDLPFKPSELTFNRILSICLPFENGIRYLQKSFNRWSEFKKFMRESSGFYFHKDWNEQDWIFYNKKEMLSWRSF